jgi:hypothetical protein
MTADDSNHRFASSSCDALCNVSLREISKIPGRQMAQTVNIQSPCCRMYQEAIAVRPWDRTSMINIVLLIQLPCFKLKHTSLISAESSPLTSITVNACSTYPSAFTLSAVLFLDKRIVQIARNQRENFSTDKQLRSRLACKRACDKE